MAKVYIRGRYVSELPSVARGGGGASPKIALSLARGTTTESAEAST